MSSDALFGSPSSDQFKKVEGMSSKKKLCVASVALLALGGGLYGYNKGQQRPTDPTPGDSFISEDGTLWRKLKDTELHQMFSASESFMADPVVNLIEDANIIPDQFWTVRTAEGQQDGWGLASGHDQVVFQSVRYKGQYMSVKDRDGYGGMTTSSDTGPREKFKPHFLAGGMVAFESETYNGKYVSCDPWGSLYVNGPRINAWEYFYVYKTSNRDAGIEGVGEEFIALKSDASNRFVTHVREGEIQCNAEQPSTWEKWVGWKDPEPQEPWRVDSVVFDTSRGKVTESPEVLGSLMINNLGGSRENILSRTISETVTYTEDWGEPASTTLPVGTEFSASVPVVGAKGLSVSVSGTVSHSIGKPEYASRTYTSSMSCNAPPHTKLECKYQVQKATVEVPYTMTLSRGEGGSTKQLSGVWTSTQTFGDHVQVEEQHS